MFTRLALTHHFKKCKFVLGSCSGLAVALSTQAQPANDNFANAWTLSGTVITTNASTAGASKEPGEPNHAGNGGARSIWFNWTAPKSGQIRVDTIGSSGGFNNDTLLAIFTGGTGQSAAPGTPDKQSHRGAQRL